jgi:hypothetical protein
MCRSTAASADFATRGLPSEALAQEGIYGGTTGFARAAPLKGREGSDKGQGR